MSPPVVDEILARRDADGVRAWFDEQGISCGVSGPSDADAT